MPLLVKIRMGETLPIDGGRIRISLSDTRKGAATISVEAPKDVRVGRVYESLSPPPFQGRNDTALLRRERPGE